MVTPFGADGSPDLPAMGVLLDFLIERGVHGLFVLGTTGEGPLLESPERRQVAEFAVEYVNGRRPVLVHCGAPDTRTAADLARHAQAIGADGAATVVPYYFTYGERELERHFREVAQAAPEIGHYVYENPERVGYSAGVPLVCRLIAEVPNILGVKDTGDSIAKVTQYLAYPGITPQVFTGNNVTIFSALGLGAAGAVSALANFAPELITGVYEAFAAGDLDRSRELQFLVARMAGATGGLPYAGAIKHLLGRRGLPGGHTRAPQPELSADQAAAFDARLAAIEGLAGWLAPVDRPALATG